MTDTVSDRACEHLDRISAGDPSRYIIMDLLDEISAKTGEIDRLRSALSSEREECAKFAREFLDAEFAGTYSFEHLEVAIRERK